MGTIFTGAERIMHDAEHLSAAISEIKNVWRPMFCRCSLFIFPYRFVQNKDVNFILC